MTLLHWLLSLGFFTSSWDLVLKLEVAGFTLKLYQLFFLVLFMTSARPADLPKLRSPFAVFMFILAFYGMGLAPWSAFPLKSFLYSAWLLFDLLAVWLAFQKWGKEEQLHRLIWGTLLFLSVIILIDTVAYQFGYRGGLLGFNQDIRTNVGTSRPHAFTSEPSYAATFLCLGFFTSVIPIFQKSRRKWLAALGIALILFALIATTSRTGWGALAIGFVLISSLPVLAGRKVRWRLVASGLVLAPVLAAGFYFSLPPPQQKNISEMLVGKLFDGSDSSGTARLKALKIAYQMALDTHGMGTGMGASYRYFIDHGGIDPSNDDPGFTGKMYGNEVIMSTWGQLIAENGFAGVVLVLFAGLSLIWALYRRWKTEESLLGALTASLVAFGFLLFWIGNVSRGDMWMWYGIWSYLAAPKT